MTWREEKIVRLPRIGFSRGEYFSLFHTFSHSQRKRGRDERAPSAALQAPESGEGRGGEGERRRGRRERGERERGRGTKKGFRDKGEEEGEEEGEGEGEREDLSTSEEVFLMCDILSPPFTPCILLLC